MFLLGFTALVYAILNINKSSITYNDYNTDKCDCSKDVYKKLFKESLSHKEYKFRFK